MPLVFGNPFAIDWTSKHAVIDYATRFGTGHSVIKVPGHSNYNIIHTSNEARYPKVTVVFRT